MSVQPHRGGDVQADLQDKRRVAVAAERTARVSWARRPASTSTGQGQTSKADLDTLPMVWSRQRSGARSITDTLIDTWPVAVWSGGAG